MCCWASHLMEREKSLITPCPDGICGELRGDAGLNQDQRRQAGSTVCLRWPGKYARCCKAPVPGCPASAVLGSLKPHRRQIHPQ